MIKTAEELEKMAASGRLLADVFTFIDRLPLVGMTTMQVNNMVEDYIVDELKSRPASKGQYDYPYVLNSSRNEVVCHGMPSDKDVIANGQIINFDITLEKDGFIADSSKTYMIGAVAPYAEKLVRSTYEALWKGIAVVRPGATVGDIGHAIERFAKGHGYGVVSEYCGHGIGREMHEEPDIIHVGKAGTGVVLREGMTFTIEPMLNQGTARVKTKKDGWTVMTKDGKLSAQFEHTVAVTADGVRVLTLRPDEEKMLDLLK
ncbi:methionyl aminopeptidase [Paenochrobactrum gallinarii]|uniref:Methionine aminopeptidase n=1 Tax=Paenochrobactrum gallinarii TaxID=643673 RepID=A0A841LSK7_9HYPH|nr:type I methionyl aminopeptidase [Paenochrobactrum gallinarii]MBB6261185.1 methionyl aminopeptidase [Paenochrobactrum gallinarii]